MKKYLVIPGYAYSGGELHLINEKMLMELYGVHPDECVCLDVDTAREENAPPPKGYTWSYLNSLIKLEVRSDGDYKIINTTAAPKVVHEFTMTVYVAAPNEEETRIKAKRLVDGLGNMMKGQGVFPMMMEEVRPVIRVKKECTMEEVAEAVYFLKPGMEFLHPELAERIEFIPESNDE